MGATYVWIASHRRSNSSWADLLTTRRSLLVLVALDLVSKAIAYLCLPRDREVSLGPALQLILVLNRTGVGTAALQFVRSERFTQLPIATLAYLSLGAAVLVVRRFRPVSRPWLAYLLAFLIPHILGRLFLPHGVVALSNFANVAMHRIAVTFLLLVCWYVSTSSPWRPAFLFLGAGAAGNLLSLLLPPFAIVDFLYSKFVSTTIGCQVFNFADAYYVLGLGVFPAFVVRWIFRQVKAARDLGRA